MHGGVPKSEVNTPNPTALQEGICNLERHLKNLTDVYGLNVVVALNKFPTDTEEEIEVISELCSSMGINLILSDVWESGGAGGIELAKEVIELCERPNSFKFAYDEELSISEKIRTLAQRVYRARDIIITPTAKAQIENLEELGFGKLPICVAKTQYSFSDNPALYGAPEDFEITIRNVKVSAGAGFIVVKTGDIMTMPGLPKRPAAENIDIDENGNIKGLF